MSEATPQRSDSREQPAERLWRRWEMGERPTLADFLQELGPLAADQLLAVVRVDQRRRWLSGERATAEAYLQSYPILAGERETAILVIYAEFLLREELGEEPGLAEYERRFPEHAEALKVQIELHRAMEASAPSGQSTVGIPGTVPRTLSTGLPAPRALPSPTIPGYAVEGEVGRGGMGIVYRARHEALRRVVALKVLRAGEDDPKVLARFRGEAEAVARMQHPHIIQVFEVGDWEGRPYVALEYVEGGSLARRLRGEPQPPREAAALVRMLAEAVQHAHERGVIHRDLKPANVMLAPHKGGRAPLNECQPKVTDFGLARKLDEAGRTHSGEILGTPSYMAPEQAEGQAAGPLADVYALGVILYECLTGRSPFKGASVVETLEQVVRTEPVPPSRLQPHTPRDLETICLKCLQKTATRRYASAAGLAKDLQRFLDGRPIVARRVGLGERGWKWAQRHPAAAALLLGSAVAAGAGLVLVLLLWQQAEATARSEGLARTAAEGQAAAEAETRRKTEEALRADNRHLAELALTIGLRQCEQGDVGPGLLWLARACISASRADDGDLLRVVRINLADWRRQFHVLRDRLPQSGTVTVVVYSPDGHMLLTAGTDRTAHLWDAAGKPLGQPLRHSSAVLAAGFSVDGHTVWTAAEDGTIQGWDTNTTGPSGEPWRLPDKPIQAAFSPGVQLLATVDGDKTVRLWERNTRQPVGPALDHGGVLDVAFRPDSKVLLTAGGKEGVGVRFWDTATGRPTGPILKLPTVVAAATFTPDGKYVATTGEDGIGRLWDAATGEVVRELFRQESRFEPLVYSPDGRFLLSGPVVRDAAGGQPIGQRLRHRLPISAAAFHPDGSHLVTAAGLRVLPAGAALANDGAALLWETAPGQALGEPLPQAGLVQRLVFSDDGRDLLVLSDSAAGLATEVRRWSSSTGKLAGTPFHKATATSVWSLSPDGRTLLTADAGNVARLWDTTTGQPLGEALSHPHALWGAAFSADGRMVATGCGNPRSGRQAFLWDAATGKPIGQPVQLEPRKFVTVPDAIAAFALSADGRTLLFAKKGKARFEPGTTAQLWDFSTGKLLASLSHGGDILAASFSPDGRTLLTASADHAARLWDVETGKLRVAALEHPDEVLAAAFRPDGTMVLTAAADGIVRLWDAASGQPTGPPLVHFGRVYGVAWAQDGRTTATFCEDGRVRLWDVSTGKQVGVPLAVGTTVRGATFAPDGRRMATGAESSVRLWSIASPIQGDPERIGLWVQVLTGMELDASGVVHELKEEARQERRQGLERLGGVP